VAQQFTSLFSKPAADNGFNQAAERCSRATWCSRAGDTPLAKVPDNPPSPDGAPRAVAEMESNKPKLAAAQS
jgi:aconitate hydratase